LFMEENVDVAILEVGLGGRLDAVNVFDADCAVITNVDLDHMDYLGDTREAIGYEKAGIFRSSRPAIYGQTDIPDRVVQQAQKVGARLQVLGREFGYERSGKTWSFHCGQDSFTGLPLPLMTGEYQLRNASAALTALLMMKERLPVSLQAMKHGLETAKVPGRFQIDGLHPQTIFDVAHNPHAARALAANLQMLPCKGRTIAVFAMLSDKDMGMVIQIMAPVINVWCIATINHVRGARADQLNELLVLKGVQSPILCFEDPVGAYEHACNVAGKNDRIIVFGSFHTVADCLVAHENAVVAG
ncbi:MAG: bifunctional folylpolyglutamate synthase/dihydrofolate synthase, partial [Pseudomonadota bacterium]|nr:bifunctional folylpolyglutamate synthase/dihydrofolate synthase [Pseudomonadota bacterium]